ncbi:MAG: hypothetical protein QOE60_1304, partial [Thermoleophilaceae bacterium]|nr:hypothetical protein [Thermoleophilaceae bacterium]
FDELLTALENRLRDHGVETERATDHFPPLQDGMAYLFVPHEFLPLTMPEVHPHPAKLRRSVALCTEQPGSHWFEVTASAAERAGAVVDINEQGAAELRRRGIRARVMRLGWIPEWDRWGGDETRARPVDVTFLGSYTERRGAALATCGSVLAGRPCYLNVSDARAPHTAGSPAFLSGADKWERLAQSKVLLNVHRSPLAYLEWQRVVEAISNGCVVLTEHSLGTAPLEPGEHFVSSSYESLVYVLEALLEDPGRLARIRRSAYDLLRNELPLSNSIGVLAEALEEAAAQDVSQLVRGMESTGARPRRLPAPRSEYERLASDQSDMAIMRMAAKHFLIGQQDFARKLAPKGEQGDTVERQSELRSPLVSVILTVYDYEDTVAGAIDSVAASTLADRELVVIEDASTDGSLEAIRTALDRHPAMPATLVARGANQGLPRARNLGLEHARGKYVFILDADNHVYPHGLERLAGALDDEPGAAFAYGLLEAFDAAGPCGIMNWRPWDPREFRYGNYIDAMAMIRRSVLESLGGYTTEPRLYGWEDFALWCAIAERGWGAVRVPEFVARYRQTLLSMISLTNIDGRAAWAALLESHSFLTA